MAEESKDDNKSTLLNPPKPPAKKEMSAREKMIARHATKGKRTPKEVVAFVAVLAVIYFGALAGYLVLFKGGSKGNISGPVVTQVEGADGKKAREELISSGSVDNGKIVATIIGASTVKDDTVSFTVEWENKGSDSVYTPSDFVVHQGDGQLKLKTGYYNRVILPSQKKRVTYTYNLHDKRDDVRVIIGKVATKGITNNADEDSSPKLVGIIIKVRGE